MRALFACCLLALGFASAEALEPPRFSTAEQDSNGTIWAFSRGDNNTAFTFDGNQWSTVAVPFPQGDQATSEQSIHLSDGAVGCLWSLNDNRMAFTWQRGKESRVLGQCPGEVPRKVKVFEDSQSRIWITGHHSEIHRIDAKTGGVFLYRIQPEDLLRPAKEWDNGIEIAEDGCGRVWVCSATGGKAYASLRGMLLFEGDQVEHREIVGIQGKWFTFLSRKDKTHMWLGVLDEGLFEVDIDTLQAKPFPSPEGELFHRIDGVFSVGTDLFVIDCNQLNVALWRFRDAKWERLIEKLDEEIAFTRSWLPLAKGILVSAEPYPWFIGDSKPPIRLDWHNGVSAKNLRLFLLRADGSLFALARKGSIFHQKITLPPPSQALSRVNEVDKDIRRWSGSPDGSLWTTQRVKERSVLSEWNGERWCEYDLPTGTTLFDVGIIAVDTSGCIWAISDRSEHKTAIFNPRTKRWQIFPKIEAAFESLINDSPTFVNPRTNDFLLRYSADHRRIAFSSNIVRLNYFDGHTWRQWTRQQISPNLGNMPIDGAPAFDEENRLCVKIANTIWKFDDEQNLWRQSDFANISDKCNGLRQSKAEIGLPKGCVTQSPDSIVLDNQGIYWLTWQNALYKCWGGSCVRVFSENESNPFGSKDIRLGAVWVDRQGNAFVETTQTGSGRPSRFQITPKSPPPQITLAVASNGADSVRVKLNAHSASKLHFRWQLDEEPWEATADHSVVLDSLPSGEHTIKALAVDEELQSGPIAAEVKFKIIIDPAKQIKALIARLADPSFTQRKAAINALSRQPDDALPALKAARLSANEDLRWWIDAAIQQIERNQRSQAKSP